MPKQKRNVTVPFETHSWRAQLVNDIFGENPKDATARNTFFYKFVTFITEYKKAHVENIQREEEQRTYEIRKRFWKIKSPKRKS